MEKIEPNNGPNALRMRELNKEHTEGLGAVLGKVTDTEAIVRVDNNYILTFRKDANGVPTLYGVEKNPLVPRLEDHDNVIVDIAIAKLVEKKWWKE